MTPGDFAEALAAELRLHAARYDRRALQEFVASAWPWIEEVPDPRRWVAEFSAAGNATGGAGVTGQRG
jgi:hypothetical protein